MFDKIKKKGTIFIAIMFVFLIKVYTEIEYSFKKHTQGRCMTAWLLYDADRAQLWMVAIFVDRRECLVDFQAPSIFEEL